MEGYHILDYQILRYVYEDDSPYRCFLVSDFSNEFRKPPVMIRRHLTKLVDNGHIVRMEGRPALYKHIPAKRVMIAKMLSKRSRDMLGVK